MRRLLPLLLLAASCGGSATQVAGPPLRVGATPGPSTSASTPPCGQPGASWEVGARSGTVRRADCDLSGVVLTYRSVGVTVPAPGTGGAATPGCVQGAECLGMEATTATNGDVTWRVT